MCDGGGKSSNVPCITVMTEVRSFFFRAEKNSDTSASLTQNTYCAFAIAELSTVWYLVQYVVFKSYLIRA